ncbi:MAG: T9SS type A sorting domain-containing protein [Bacteroidales bacterium]|nr:T9SS type A sorting domain-containing protein [Bacteroidales bacterium]
MHSDLPVNSLITKIEVTDADNDQQHTFSIVSGNSSGNYSIGVLNGELKLANSYSVTQNSIHNLVVKVSDNGSGNLSDTANITIKILYQAPAETNNPPVIQSKTLNVSSTLSTGTILTTLLATDPDESQNHIYSIIEGNSAGYYSIGSVNGQLKLANAYSVTQNTTHNLIVKVIDNGPGNLSGTANIAINVSYQAPAETNHPPVIQSKTLNVSNQLSPGSLLSTLTVFDPDINQSHIFSILDGNSENHYSIGQYNGQLVLINPYQFQYDTIHKIRINVRDNGENNLSDTAIITINISSRNFSEENHAPEIQDQEFIVQMNDDVTQVGIIEAYDLDHEQELIYEITDGDHEGLFELNETSGLLVLNTNEIEEQDTFNIKVAVKDNAVPQLSSHAKVKVVVFPKTMVSNEVNSQVSGPEIFRKNYNEIGIRNIESGSLISIYSITGVCVFQLHQDNNSEASINTSDFQNGNYIICIYNQFHKYTEKFI